MCTMHLRKSKQQCHDCKSLQSEIAQYLIALGTFLCPKFHLRVPSTPVPKITEPTALAFKLQWQSSQRPKDRPGRSDVLKCLRCGGILCLDVHVFIVYVILIITPDYRWELLKYIKVMFWELSWVRIVKYWNIIQFINLALHSITWEQFAAKRSCICDSYWVCHSALLPWNHSVVYLKRNTDKDKAHFPSFSLECHGPQIIWNLDL